MLESQSVLLVEDIPEIARVCATFLELAGADVRVVGTVGEALAAIGQSHPDAIVADVNLASGQCAALYGAIRDTFDGPSIPIVVLSGDPDARSGFVAGVSRRRPFEAADLVLAVEHAVSSRRQATCE